MFYELSTPAFGLGKLHFGCMVDPCGRRGIRDILQEFRHA